MYIHDMLQRWVWRRLPLGSPSEIGARMPFSKLGGRHARNHQFPTAQPSNCLTAQQTSKMAEDAKIAVRNVRKDAMKKSEKVEFPKVRGM